LIEGERRRLARLFDRRASDRCQVALRAAGQLLVEVDRRGKALSRPANRHAVVAGPETSLLLQTSGIGVLFVHGPSGELAVA
jgi:hypothetical protein